MPEPSRLIERIAADLADVRWPDAAEIRARLARRRRRRAVAAGGLATVVAIAVALPVTLDTGGDDSGNQIAGAPQLVEIPPEALLQPEDVGAGLVALRETVAANQNVGSVQLLDLAAVTCPAYRSVGFYSGPYRYQRSYTVQTPPTDPGDPTTGDTVLRQYVLRLDGDLATRVADDMKRATVACADYSSGGPAENATGVVDVEATHRIRVVHEGFAGDQSFVFTHAIEVTRVDTGRPYTDPVTRLQAVIRVGDLVSLISWMRADVDPTEARRLATRAASWLCVASNPPC
jgi:hypothetical protein